MKVRHHLFEWPSRHNVHLALPFMLVVSFLLHAAGVMIFKVTYPGSRPSPERSAQIFFLRPGSEEAVRVAPLLAASDPALFSPAQTSGRHAGKLAATGYVASFDSQKPALTPLPAVPSVLALPARSSLGPVTVGPGESQAG